MKAVKKSEVVKRAIVKTEPIKKAPVKKSKINKPEFVPIQVKKAEPIKKVKPKIIKPKIIKSEFIPLQIVTIHSEKVERTVFPKYEILTKVPLPDSHIRCLVLKDFNGMMDILRAGDIIDIPERRYKSLLFRGMVTPYTGESQPNKNR